MFRLLILPILISLFVVSNSNADLVTVQFNDSVAEGGLIDGTSENFVSTLQMLGDSTFRFVINVVSDGGILIDASDELGHVGGGDNFDTVGEAVTFTITTIDFTAGATGPQTASEIIFTARELNFDSAFAGNDSGEITEINGIAQTGFVWAEIDGDADFVGHRPATNAVDLFITNGNQNVTSFKHDFVDGSWRIDNLGIEFTPVPEPSAFGMIVLFGIGMAVRRRRV